MTLLHYIAVVVKEKYPELANFFNELHFVDKAAAGDHRVTHTDTMQLEWILLFSLYTEDYRTCEAQLK